MTQALHFTLLQEDEKAWSVLLNNTPIGRFFHHGPGDWIVSTRKRDFEFLIDGSASTPGKALDVLLAHRKIEL